MVFKDHWGSFKLIGQTSCRSKRLSADLGFECRIKVVPGFVKCGVCISCGEKSLK